MPKKPTPEDARVILQFYDLRREAEMRKARSWWLGTFWPKSADDFVNVMKAAGTEENAWLRQVGGYWNMAAHMVLKGAINSELFFDMSVCGEMYFIFAKVRPFLADLRQKAQNPQLFANIEKAIMSSKAGKAHLAEVQKRVDAMRATK